MKKIISTLKRNSRRYLSLILVFGMMFSVLFPNMSLDKVSKVYAANPNTEMQPEPQLNREENTSNTTIAYWKSTSVLDFQGKQTDNASYSTSNTNAFKTTYSNGGFQFYYVLSDSQISTTNDGGKVCNFIGGNNGNGGINQDITGVEFKVTTKTSPDKKFVLLDLHTIQMKQVNI